ncbi:MAG: putative manganese transporter [Oscillospiraceae bacterium]
MLDILIDAALDCLKLLPFLFLTYLILELIEKKAEEGSLKLVRQSGAWGPVIGSALGLIPQCGFSASASNLFSQRLISAGTLLAVFLSTSDEMLPILISEAADIGLILKILCTKLLAGIAVGLIADKLLRLCRHSGETVNLHELCEQENCHCEERGIFVSALLHTLQIAAFILIINIVLNAVIFFIGEDTLAGLILNKPVIGPIISGIVGLIPNCAASIIITELYLSGAMSTGAMLSGLLASAGVGLLVLFRINRRQMRDNFTILAALYISAAVIGIAFDLLNITF